MTERISLSRKEYDELCHCLSNSILSVTGIIGNIRCLLEKVTKECIRLEDQLNELKQTKHIDDLYDI